MAKKHSGLTTSDLHHPKGILVESTASMLVMSQSISTATGSFHFIPGSNDTYTLGNSARAWKELYVSTGSIHFMEKDGTVARTLDVDATGFGFGGGDVSGSTISGSKLHIVGDTFIGGDLTLGDADSDSISIGADITSHLTPNADNNYDLGTSAKQWKDIYINGIGYIDQLGTDADPVTVYVNGGEIDGTVIGGESAAAATITTLNITSMGSGWTNASNTIADLGSVTTCDINGGAIDGATIATSDITVGSGKTLNVSAGTLTLAANQISGDKVEGGTIAATTITALTTAGISATTDIDIGAHDLRAATITPDGLTSGRVVFAGTAGVLSDDSDFTFSTDTLTATKIGAFEAAGAIDFSDENMTNVDIDSGAIDGTTIGAASAAAGTFAAIVGTTIDATTDFTIGGTVITNNTITDDGTLVIASSTATSFSDGNITNVGDIALDTISADGSSFSMGSNWTNASRTVADLGTVTTVDINGGSVDGATIGAASHTTIKGTTIDATTDFTIDGLVITADTITNDSNLTMDLAGDLAIDVDGGDVTITDNGADILTINATTISGSATSSGSFAHIAVNSVSASRMEIDSIQGNWTNAGNTVADLGSITTVDINGGTINGITDLAVADGGTGASSLNNLITLGTHTTGNYVAAITSGTGLSGGVSSEGATSTLSVDAAQTQITSVGTIGTGTWEATDVAVAHGGTGVSTLTDGGILLGSGTSAVTATAVLGDGEILIGDGTTDPVALDVGGSGAITILGTIATGVWQGTTVAVNQGGTGVTSSTGTTNVVLSGSPTIVTPTIASFANATHDHADSAGGGVIALTTATSGNYVATITGGTGITSTANTTGEGTTHSLSVDAAQTQITSVGTIGTGVWQGTAINDTYIDTINNANKVALTALDIDGGTDVGEAIVDADLIILDNGAGGTNRKATMSRLKTYMSGVSGGSTLGNVQVGVTAAAEIDTTSGNLVIDSAGGTTTLDDHVIISGDLTVSGTRTIVNSTTVDIADNIIELNAGTSDGGIYVKETQGGAATGSMVYDVSADRWMAGVAGSEKNVVLIDTSDTLTNKTLTTPTIGSFTNATHNHTNAAGGGQIALATAASDNYVATNVAGTAISVSGATGNVTITNTGVTSAVAGSGIDVSGATGAVTISIGTGEVVNAMIGDNEVNSEHYAAGSIDNEHIADDAIDSEHYAAGSIDTAHIAADQITSALIADDQINSEHYVDASIDLAHLASDSVDGSKIVDDAINSEHYAAGSIDTAHIAADQITSALIADDQIDSEHYVDASIDTQHIGADQITAALIADDVINSEHYAAGSIDNEHIADDAINSEHYAAASIDNEHLADDAVDSDELAAGAVDDAHLSDGVATGLAGAGMTATSGVLNVIASTGITANADNITTNDSQIVHDSLSGFVANEHIDHTGVSISAGGILSGGGTIAATRTITLASSDVVHDSTSGFVANEHIDHTGVTLTAGTGLNGGGTIASNRTFTVDAAQTVITSLFATDIKIGEDDQTKIDFETADTINFYTNNVHEFQMTSGGTFHADADIVAYSSTVASDKKLKTNINDTKYGLSDILKLRGVDFNWKEKFEGKRDVGFIAQEVQEIIPELVKEVDSLGENVGDTHLTVDYAKVVPILVESIRELKKEIDDLKSN